METATAIRGTVASVLAAPPAPILSTSLKYRKKAKHEPSRDKYPRPRKYFRERVIDTFS